MKLFWNFAFAAGVSAFSGSGVDCHQCKAQCPLDAHAEEPKVEVEGYGAHMYTPNQYKKTTLYLPAYEATRPDEVLDIAYIGAGFGSGWMQWKLSEKVKKPFLASTFEKSERIGGRFMSVDPHVDDAPGSVVDEFGGMRIFPDIMPGMKDVVQSFAPPDVPWEDTLIPSPLIQPENFFFDFQNNDVKMSRMDMKEPYASYESRFDECYKAYKGDLNDISAVDFLMYECNFTLTECGQYIATVGYDFKINLISAEEFQNEKSLTTSQTTQYLLKIGWQEMVKQMTHRGGSYVAFGRKLSEIESVDDGIVKLGFEDGSSIRAKNVYITTAPAAWYNIKGLDHWIPELKENVVRGDGTKIFLTWDENWWKPLGLTSGRSVVNNELVRQVFYWDENTILLYTAGFYGEGEFTTPDGETTDCLPALTHCKLSSKVVDEKATTDMGDLIRQIVDILATIHGVDVPMPVYTRYKYWPNLWGMFHTGVDIDAFMEKTRRPLGPDVPVWYGSSMVSRVQGWAEGAIQRGQASIDEIAESLEKA